MAATDVQAFEDATVDLSLSGNMTDGYYTVADGTNKVGGIKVNKIVTANNQTIDLNLTTVARDYKVEIVTVDEDGNYSSATNEVVNPGTYAVKVTAIDGVYKGGELYVPFTVKPATLNAGDLEVYEINANPSKIDDTQFIFTGSELDLGIKSSTGSSTAALTEGVDYEVKFITPDMGQDDPGVEVKNIGKYYAVVTGLGIYAGQTVTVDTPVNVTAFKLDTPGVSILCDPVIDSSSFPGHPTTVYYYNSVNKTYTYLDTTLVDLSIDSTGTGSDVFDKLGTYNLTANPAKAAGLNVISFAKTTIDKYDHAATIEYNNSEFPTSWETDLSEGRKQNKFNPLLIQAFNSKDEKIGTTVYIYDEDGALEAEIQDGRVITGNFDAWRNSAGTYTVKVVAGDKTNYTAGGTATCTVRIVWGTIDADASVYFNYKNDKGQWTAVSSVETTYDGSDVMDRIQTVVKDADGKELTEGTGDKQYTVTIKDAEGNVVDKIVDAGSYTVEISVKGYDVTGTTTLPVTVAKKSFDKVVNLETTHFSAVNSNYDYLPWREGGVPVSDIEKRLEPGIADNFTVTILKDGVAVNEVTDEGVYTLHFEPKTDSVTDNFETPADFEFLCVKDGTSGDFVDHTKFSDVIWSDHFADSVAWVSAVGREYMTGYSDTNLFGGRDSITRADVVGTLYKMAGGDGLTVSNDLYDVLVGWKSFDDVDGNEYYGRALAWAKSVGVANGDGGNFRPNDKVTREEFAAFLANYAELFDKSYEAADESALDAMPDAGQVSDWARGSVAWAVENGIMGNGGSIDPSSAIIRGDVAGMVYNYAK